MSYQPTHAHGFGGANRDTEIHPLCRAQSELSETQGCADKDSLFNLAEKTLELYRTLMEKGDLGNASAVWHISAELFRMACRHNVRLTDGENV